MSLLSCNAPASLADYSIKTMLPFGMAAGKGIEERE